MKISLWQRILSVILAFAMVCGYGVMGVGESVVNAVAQIPTDLFNEDFEDVATGVRPVDIYTNLPLTDTSYSLKVVEVAGNKVLSVGTQADATSNVSLQLWYELASAQDEVTLSYNIMQKSAHQSNFLTVTNSTTTGITAPTVRFGTGSTNLRYYDGSAAAAINLTAANAGESISHAVNQWHTVRVVYAKSGGCKVFIDGILTNVTTTKSEDISRIGMYISGKNGDAFYIDNIRVTEGIGADGNGSHGTEVPEVEDLDWTLDFENETVGARPSDIQTNLVSTDTSYSLKVAEVAGNKVLSVGTDANAASNVYLQWWYALPASYNEVTLSYKIMQLSGHQSNFLTVSNSSLSAPAVRFGTGTTNLVYYDGTSSTQNALAAANAGESVSHALNQWHTVKVVYAKSGVCKVFIDGVLTNVTTTKTEAIARIGMYVAGKNGDAFYIDDIRVTEGIGADGNGSHGTQTPEVEDLDWTLDFEDETVGARPNNILTDRTETDYTVEVKDVAGNKVLAVGTNAAAGETIRLSWWYELPAAYNEVTLSYKILQVSARQSNFLTVSNSSLSAPAVRFGTGTTDLRYYSDHTVNSFSSVAAANAGESVSHALNQWHTVKVVYAKSGVCKVFIDGVLTNVTTTKTEAIARIGMYVVGNSTQVGTAFYIDDIRVTEGIGTDGNGSHQITTPEVEDLDWTLDFENETVGARPNNILTDRTETDYTVEVKDVAGNKVLSVGTNAAEGDTVRLSWWYELPAAYNEVTLSYKILQVSARQSNFLTVSNSSLSAPAVRFGTGTTDLRYYSDHTVNSFSSVAAANAGESVSHALNKWHVVKIVYAKSGVCKVFIDGVLTNVTTTKTEAIARIGMYVAGNSTQVGTAFYIDDIRVTEGIGADGNGSHEVELPEVEVLDWTLDFENETVGARPNNILTDRTETDYTVEVKDVAGNKVLAVGTNAAEGETVRLSWWYELPAAYNEVTLSYKILQVSARQSNFLTVTNSSLSNPTVRFGTGTTDLRSYGNSAEAPNDYIGLVAADANESVTHALNKWHVVKIVYAKSGVCKVFIDGILTNVTTHKEDAIARIGMYVAGNHMQVGDAFYIDDIRVTEGIGADGNGSHEVELPEVEDLDWTLDFENETVGARPDDIHTNLAETDTSYSIKVTEVAGNKVLSVGTQATEGANVYLQWWYELPAAYNEVTLSYKIMQVSARQSNFLTVGSSSLAAPTVRFGTGTTNLVYYDGTSSTQNALAAADANENITHAVNQWHVVKIVYAKSGVCKVFIDGILTNVTTTKTEAIYRIGMYVAGNHTQVGDAFYIDDIRVTEGIGADGNGSHEVQLPEVEDLDWTLDFENETVGARPDDIHTNLAETDTSYSIKVTEVAGNKVLAVGTNAAEGETVRLEWWYELPAAYNEVTLSYKILQVSARQSNFFTVTNSSLSNPTVRFGTGTTNLRYYDGSANAVAQDIAAADANENITHSLNQWHVVKIVYAKSGVCKVFIDGILTNVTTTKTDAISYIGMYVAGNHTQPGDAFYIDDIRVTEGIGADGNGSHEVEIPEPEVDPNRPQVNPDGSLLSKDFEGETVGARPNNILTNIGADNPSYSLKVEEVAGNKVLAVGTNAAEGETVRLEWWYELPDTYNEVTLSYKILQVSARQSNFLTVTNSSISNPTVRFGTGTTNLRYYDGSANAAAQDIAAVNADEAVKYSLNKWHIVKIVYAKSGVCKVFIDGVLTNVTTTKAEAIARVGMYVAGNSTQPGTAFYIDDIYVTEGVGADGNGSHEVEIPEPEVDSNIPQVNPDGSLLSKDFQGETVGARPNNILTNIGADNPSYSLKVEEVAGNKVLAVGTNAAEGETVRLELWYHLPASYNEVTLSYKLMQVSARQSNFLTVTNSSLSSPAVRFGTGTTNLRYYDGSANAAAQDIAAVNADEAVKYSLNKWHIVKIVYAQSGVCKVFIDGVLTNITTTKTEAIARVGMYVAGNSTQPGTAFYIDDIYVTEGVGADGNGSHEVEIPEPEVDPNRPQVTPDGDLINTDFESDALDARPAGWVTNMDENAEATGYSIGVVDFEENKVLAVKVDKQVDFQMWHMLPTDQDKLTLSYHIYQAGAGISFFPTVSTSTTASPTVTFGVLSTALKYTGKWADLLPKDSSEDINYKLNKWHTVKVVYDKTAEVPVKVYINGVLTNVETTRFETIDRIAMRIFANGGQFYIDNIRVTSGVGDDGNGSHEVAELPKREELPEGVLVDMNFENVADGKLPKYSMFSVAGLTGPQDIDECYAGVKTINGNKVLAFRLDQGFGYLTWYYPFEEPHDKVTISYHVAKPDATGGWMDFPTVSTGKTPSVPLVQYGVNTIFGKALVFCDNSKRNGLSLWNNIQPEGTVGNTGQFFPEELKWYEVKMVYETRENGKEADVKVYIDGVLTNVYAITEDTNAPAENLLIRITKNGGYIYYDNIKVTVDDHEPAEKPAYPKDPDVVVSTIVPSVNSLTLPSGGHGFLTATAMPENATDRTLVYTSSDPEIATVDQWGEVIGLKPGNVTITVTPVFGAEGVKLEIPVTITEKSVMQTIYVSNEGGGNGSSETSRCTLKEAMAKVSAIKTMTGDIVVSLAPGYYQQTETLKFNESHGGKNNYYVIYKAEGEVTFGGKKVITGWTDEDGDGIYSAPAAGIQTRHLYVDNVRAVRARSQEGLNRTKYLTDSEDNNIGYICNDVEIADFAYPEDLEMVYFKTWHHMRCGVDSVKVVDDKLHITMTMPGFDYLRENNGRFIAYYENALELLDEPGEWYLDTHKGVVYYMPREWEDMSQVEISAAVVEDLIWIEGSDYDNMVQNIQFEGITFADTTWNRPTEVEHHSAYQNNYITNEWDENGNQIPDYLPDAAVTVKRANTVNFVGCTFTRMGIMGLKMVEGVQNSRIVGNKFYDISGNAIAIGEADYNNKDVFGPKDIRMMMKNCDILNNYIHHIGVDYQSSAAISVGWAADMDISYNEVFDTPYSGTHIGYGWQNVFANVLINLRMEHNFFHDTLVGDTFDGGAFYFVGMSGGNENNWNLISENYIRNTLHGEASFYNDAGSTYYEYSNNVIDESERFDIAIRKQIRMGAWVCGASYGQIWRGRHNYVTVNKMAYVDEFSDAKDTIVCEPNNYPAEALKIIEEAGLQSEYLHLQNSYAERVFTNFGYLMDLADVGSTYKVEMFAFDGKDNGTSTVVNPDLKVLKFYMEDTKIATVTDDGLVTAVKKGQTSLFVTVQSGTILKTLEYPVYVGDKLEEIVVQNAENGLMLYMTDAPRALSAYGLTGKDRKVVLQNVKYEVADTRIASVTEDGILAPLSVGKTILRVTGEYFGNSVTTDIELNVERTPRFVLHNMWEIFDDQYKTSWSNGPEMSYSENKITKLSSMFTKFTGRLFGNELMSFTLRVDKLDEDRYPWISVRAQDPDFNTTMDTGYVFVFGERNGLELHRFNNGMRTQIYGNLSAYEPLGGPAIKGKFEWGKDYDIQLGALTEENGVRLILRINGEEIINFLDTSTDAIKQMGYFDMSFQGTMSLMKNTDIPDKMELIASGNGEWLLGSNQEYRFESSIEIGELPIYLNGELLDSQYYSVSGNTIILTAACMESLGKGIHILEVLDPKYGDNVRVLSAIFEVVSEFSEDNIDDGNDDIGGTNKDSSTLKTVLLVVLIVAALGCVAAVVVLVLKRKRSAE